MNPPAASTLMMWKVLNLRSEILLEGRKIMNKSKCFCDRKCILCNSDIFRIKYMMSSSSCNAAKQGCVCVCVCVCVCCIFSCQCVFVLPETLKTHEVFIKMFVFAHRDHTHTHTHTHTICSSRLCSLHIF